MNERTNVFYPGKGCIWSMVSGRGIPKVSGSRRLSNPDVTVRHPMMM